MKYRIFDSRCCYLMLNVTGPLSWQVRLSHGVNRTSEISFAMHSTIQVCSISSTFLDFSCHVFWTSTTFSIAELSWMWGCQKRMHVLWSIASGEISCHRQNFLFYWINFLLFFRGSTRHSSVMQVISKLSVHIPHFYANFYAFFIYNNNTAIALAMYMHEAIE